MNVVLLEQRLSFEGREKRQRNIIVGSDILSRENRHDFGDR
jgi:hypothetical protein